MNLKILGAHNIESRETRCISLLIDDVLAIDAGALTSSLSLPAQQKLQAVLLTHQHYDHIRDIPALGINYYLQESTVDIYATRPVLEALSAHLLNDVIYPDYTQKPPERPAVRFHTVVPGRELTVASYMVLPVSVHHAVPTVGYQVTSPGGEKLFYTSDTGPGLKEAWRRVTPDLLIIELTAINKYDSFSIESGHLTPTHLQQELESYRKINGYLPRVVLVHMNPIDELELKAEIGVVEASLKTEILFGHEGMEIEI
jgi:ribonuclease BN (tRNA processing enzyme)